ncbi:MAG: hypothetical protein HOV87_33920 [Catenulispora sp.]|nr:hypothetical protein [Catenulispora sp.]
MRLSLSAARAAITVSSAAILATAVVSSASAAGTSVVTTPCSAAGQKLGNPGFETGTAPWSSTPAVVSSATGGEAAHTGKFVAWLDGYGTTHTDTLSQPVAIPPAPCTSEVLSFWLHIDTSETTITTAFDKLQVQVITAQGTITTVATFSNLNHATGYLQHSYNLAPWAGQTITLKFLGTEDASLQTSFVVDDTAVTIS